MMVEALTLFLEIKSRCVSEVLYSNVPGTYKKGSTGQGCEGQGQHWFPWPWDGEDQDPEYPAKIRAATLVFKRKIQGWNGLPRVCILGDVLNLTGHNPTCLSWYCFEQRGFTPWPQWFLSASATHWTAWYVTLTETIIVNSSLQKLEFDGKHLTYLWKDGDKSYVDQLKDLCVLVYFDICHKELCNITHQKFLDYPQNLSKLFLKNKLLCFLIGKHRLKSSNELSKIKSKKIRYNKNKCHIMTV